MSEYYFSIQSIADWQPKSKVTGNFITASEFLSFTPPPINPGVSLTASSTDVKNNPEQYVKLNLNSTILLVEISGSVAIPGRIIPGRFGQTTIAPTYFSSYNVPGISRLLNGSTNVITVDVDGSNRQLAFLSNWGVSVDLKALATFALSSLRDTYTANEDTFRLIYNDISNACRAGKISFYLQQGIGLGSGQIGAATSSRSSLAPTIRKQGTSWPTINPNGKRTTSSNTSNTSSTTDLYDSRGVPIKNPGTRTGSISNEVYDQFGRPVKNPTGIGTAGPIVSGNEIARQNTSQPRKPIVKPSVTNNTILNGYSSRTDGYYSEVLRGIVRENYDIDENTWWSSLIGGSIVGRNTLGILAIPRGAKIVGANRFDRIIRIDKQLKLSRQSTGPISFTVLTTNNRSN